MKGKYTFMNTGEFIDYNMAANKFCLYIWISHQLKNLLYAEKSL